MDQRIIGGKAEKSKGSALFRPIMIIKSASRILNVNKISSIKGGMGSTNIAKTTRTTPGIAIDDQEIVPKKCRRSDTVSDAAAINILNWALI